MDKPTERQALHFGNELQSKVSAKGTKKGMEQIG